MIPEASNLAIYEKIKGQKKKRLIIPAYIQKFIDPINYHRLFRDFVVPDKILNLSNEKVFPFTLLHKFKFLKQLHIRKKGILLDFEDFNENSVSSIPLLKSRMLSLGDSKAADFALLLDEFDETSKSNYVVIDDDEDGKEKFKSNFNDKEKKNFLKNYFNEGSEIINWIDEIFENSNELLIIRGNKLLLNDDRRWKYLGMNQNLLSLISNENEESINYFSKEFIQNCLEILAFENIFTYLERFLNISKVSNHGVQEAFQKIVHIKTAFGILDVPCILSFKVFKNEKIEFHIFSIRYEDLPETYKFTKKNGKLIERKKNEEYAKLYECYYPNVCNKKREK